jgi:hypothetical protein
MYFQKLVSKLSEILAGLIIPDPDPVYLPIPDPGSRGQKGTGSRIRIRNTVFYDRILLLGGDDPHRALADISLEDLDWPSEKV